MSSLLISLLILVFLASGLLCYLNADDETELFHLFGITNKQHMPTYWIDKPSKIFDANGLLYSVTFDGQKHYFRLKEHTDLFSSGFHSVIRYSDYEEELKFDESCVYVGESVSDENVKIALVGCGNTSRGLIVKGNGSYLIHPTLRNRTERHIIHKRSLHTIRHKYARDDPLHDDSFGNSIFRSFTRHAKIFDDSDLTIELGVFVDDALWSYFKELYSFNAEVELQRYVLAIVNNIGALFGHSSMKPKIHIKITRYEVIRQPPVELNRQLHFYGEVDRLLERFCDYQKKLNTKDDSNPRHWDHALLLSGFDLYRPGMQAIAGYAPVRMMCSEDRSCTINEGLDFGSVFVIAHEIGHSLGMDHDGDNGCDPNCCVMSRSIGSGKTGWSECSVEELKLFVSQLGKGDRQPNCLLDGSTRRTKSLAVLPGQQFTLDEQCILFHGSCWKHELKDDQDLKDVCKIVWCGNGEGIVRTAHPALEGSYCGKRMWCIRGKCVRASSVVLHVVHGGWSEWNDYSYGNCESGCIPCSIQNQIRIRRSYRQCSNPYPNNGGKDCQGDSVRGLVCDSQRCTGLTPDNYASKRCLQLKNTSNELSKQLSGTGYQYEEALCKVWCVIEKDRIRTIENYPDGTPCGFNKYCIRGECRNLACNGKAVVDFEFNCPSFTKSDLVTVQPLSGVKAATYQQVSSDGKAVNVTPSESYTEWSEWGSCQIFQCGRLGYRVRSRKCLSSRCRDSLRQKQACYVPCHSAREKPQRNASWSEWSPCSVSCGSGIQVRYRNCINCDSKLQKRQCYKVCPSNWSNWEEWSQCSKTCGLSTRIRYRHCDGSKCEGKAAEIQRCNTPFCRNAVRREYGTTSKLTQWSEWGEWERCSVSCGKGVTKRTRKCSIPRACKGLAYKVSNCIMPPCR